MKISSREKRAIRYAQWLECSLGFNHAIAVKTSSCTRHTFDINMYHCLAYIHVCVCLHVYVRVWVYVRICMYVCVRTYIFSYVRVCVCLCVCVCTYPTMHKNSVHNVISISKHSYVHSYQLIVSLSGMGVIERWLFYSWDAQTLISIHNHTNYFMNIKHN